MKIEVGKSYRTRGGDRVKIILKDNDYIYPYDGCNYLSYTSSGAEFVNGESVNDLIAEWTDTPEVGTLQEIGAQVGDVVAARWGDAGAWTEYTYVKQHPELGFECLLCNENGSSYIKPEDAHLWEWRIISRANQGPVREVTRKEIVPGVYGPVKVVRADDGCDIFVSRLHTDNIGQLDDVINYLTAIRDAIADSNETSCGALE